MGDCLLPGGPESSILPFVVWKYGDQNIQNCNFFSVVLCGWETWSLALMEESKNEGVLE
jgi:hypothetical protein